MATRLACLFSTRCPSLVLTQRATISQSNLLLKKKQQEKKKAPVAGSTIVHAGDNEVVKETMKELQRVEGVLTEELARHFSLQVDIRQYEDINVKLDSGKEHKLSHLGRVTLKSPHMVMINFGDNPSSIKAAKLAIQKSSLNVTPQHEGVVLYVNVPPMSRERREQLANDAKGKILNDYKKALNEIYGKSDKRSTQEFSSRPDEARKTRQTLLDLKHGAEQRGAKLVDAKREQLLKQSA